LPLALFHHIVVIHVPLVVLVDGDDVELGFCLIDKLTLLRLKHEVQHIWRIIIQQVQSVREIEGLLHAELLLKLGLLELLNYFVLASTA